MTLPSVGELLAGSAEALGRTVVTDAAEERIGGRLGALGVALGTDIGVEGVLQALYGGLDLSMHDVLLSGWKSLRELQPYRDPVRYPPETAMNLRIGKHEIRSVHKPRVEVTLNDATVGELVFELKLRLEIASAELLVRDGRIWNVRASDCAGDCALSYDGFLIKKVSFGPFSLPGEIRIDGGLPIPALPDVMV